jgi:malonyl-CoA O-methyltransferase
MVTASFGDGRPTAPSRPDPAALARCVNRWHHAAQEPWLHGEVARRMAERLPLFRVQPQRIVQWWGPSAGHQVLRAAYPGAEIIVAAPTVIVENQSRPDKPSHPWWRRFTAASPAAAQASARDDAAPAAASQLLWANMVLHAAPDLATLLARWHAALSVEGALMFSTIGPDTLRELRDLYRDEGWGAHAAEPIDMHDIGDALVHAGFADPVMDQERLTLHWADPRALLAELRGLGLNAAPSRHAGLRTPRWLERLHVALAARSSGGRIALTFEIVYGHAFKVAPRSADARISVDELASSLPSRRGDRAPRAGRASG